MRKASGQLGDVDTKLKNLLVSLEEALNNASNGGDDAPVHTAAAAVNEALHEAIKDGGTYLKKAAGTLNLALQSGGHDASVVMVRALKVAVEAGGSTIQDSVNDAEKALHSAVNVVESFIRVSRGASSLSSGVAEILTGAAGATVDAAQAVESVGSLPFRLVTNVVSAAIKSFVTGDKQSPVLTIARAAVAAIEAATNTDTPLKAATEAFKNSIENPIDAGPPDDSMVTMVKNMADLVESLQENAPSSSILYDFMIQALAWTWELNRLVKEYPEDECLQLAAENVGAVKAVVKMQRAIEGRFKT